MKFDLQPSYLENELVNLIPLQENDFESLYNIASDPLIWEQHPNKNRFQKDVFLNYFEGALLSKGAFLILDSKTNQTAGCTRFYDYNEEDKSLLIGYTFIARNFWGKGFNTCIKKLMLDYAFQYIETVYFHIGANNIRSQKAIEKIGAVKIGEQEVEYYGEDSKLNYIYKINKK
jgi:RimJ/RimL family protein N-acetyltransferase